MDARSRQRQLKDLGYDDDRFQAQATFWVESGEHLSRVLVGLEPLKPLALQAFDVRFGLAVPYTGPAFDDVEELRIEPPRIGPCRVSIRGEPLSPAAVFAAEAFVGPPIEVDEAVWLLIRHADFTVSFAAHGVQFRTEGDFNRRRPTPSATCGRSPGPWPIWRRARGRWASSSRATLSVA